MLDATSPREPAKVVLDVLQAELELNDAHCLMGDQKWDIPPDRELFLVAHDKGGPVISTASYLDTSVTPPVEVQQSVVLHDIMIDIMSHIDPAARLRKEEVGLALESFLSKQLMETNNCQISRIQPIVDATAAEETGTLWRYVTHVFVTALHTKTKASAVSKYFSKFNLQAGPTHDAADGTVLSPQEVINP